MRFVFTFLWGAGHFSIGHKRTYYSGHKRHWIIGDAACPQTPSWDVVVVDVGRTFWSCVLLSHWSRGAVAKHADGMADGHRSKAARTERYFTPQRHRLFLSWFCWSLVSSYLLCKVICSACCLDAEGEQASGSGCYASQLTELIPLQGISAAGQAIGEHTSLCLVTIRKVCVAGFFLLICKSWPIHDLEGTEVAIFHQTFKRPRRRRWNLFVASRFWVVATQRFRLLSIIDSLQTRIDLRRFGSRFDCLQCSYLSGALVA